MKQRILTLILMVSIVISMTTIPVSVSATTNGDCGESLKWSLEDNGTLTISGEGEMYDYNYDIIDGNGYSNTPWSDKATSIKKVIIEEGVTKIGDYAFRGCDNLNDATFPNGLIEIGRGSFMGTDLSKVILPDSVKKLNNACFYLCFNLAEVQTGKSIEYIGMESFASTELTTIILPQSLNYIGECAFNMSNLNTIYYEGSSKQWDNINKSNAWDYNYYGANGYVINYKESEKTTDYASYNPNSINISIDGNYIKFDVQPQIINGRTMVPMRKIFEELGVTIDWDDSTQTAIGTKENTVVKFTINDYTMYKNESAKTLDIPAQLINGRTLIPLRAVSEAFDCQVGWDGNDSIVSIIDDSENYTMLYALGDRSKSFPSNTVDAQLTVGWYTEPVQTLYAVGKSAVFKKTEVEAQLSVGWYTEPVTTMYAPDGRTINVPNSEIEAYKKVGWYTDAKTAIASAYPKHGVNILLANIWDVNSVGGVEPQIIWRNDSGKTIKYIYFTCVLYNAVGDKISCDITGKTTAKLQSTGPYAPFSINDKNTYGPYYNGSFYYNGSVTLVSDSLGERSVGYGENKKRLTEDDYKFVYNIKNYWDPIWYNYSADSIKITKINVIYMDGTTETISNPPIWSEVFKNAGI